MATNEEIMTALVDMRKDVCSHLHDMTARADATDKAIASIDRALGVVDRSLTALDDQVTALSEAKRSNSMRAKTLSDADLETSRALADEIAARKVVAEKVDKLTSSNELQLAILTRLDSVAKNPLVKTLSAVVVTAFITWLATKGIQVPK